MMCRLLVWVLCVTVLDMTWGLVVRGSGHSQYSRVRRTSRVLRGESGSSVDEGGESEIKVNVRLLDGIDGVERESWNRLVENSHPFLLYDWILSLEKSGCASAEAGWQPLHIIAEKLVNEETKESELIGAMPLYAKSHSYGEFIFDQSWADYAQRVLGIKYYPKLLSAVPFTPATGSRLLLSDTLTPKEIEGVSTVIMNAMKTLMQQNRLSGAHANFLKEEEVDAFLKNDYVLRQTVQYRWNNKRLTQEGNEQKFRDMNREEGGLEEATKTFTTFDDYLTCFKSKRRTQIKRERKSVYDEQGILLKVIRGNDPEYATPELYQKMYEIYTTTIDKMWGQRYLSSDFFHNLASAPSEFRERIVFIVAYDPNRPPAPPKPEGVRGQVLDFMDGFLDLKTQKQTQKQSLERAKEDEGIKEDGGSPYRIDNIIAGTINLVSDTHFYGRYWGALEYRKHLHFETCYYKSIEFCIENGLKILEPGAGGGEFKFLRGFDPFLINSVHTFNSPILQKAVSQFVDEEREYNEEVKNYLLSSRR